MTRYLLDTNAMGDWINKCVFTLEIGVKSCDSPSL